MNDDPLRDCPGCGESTLNKKISAPVFRLKGSGWYETDFKSGNKKQLADSGSEKNDRSTGGQGEAKSEPGGKSQADGGAEKTSDGAAKTKTESSAVPSTKPAESPVKSPTKTRR